MRLEYLKIKDLKKLIGSKDFKNWPHIPITAHRAISQMNNPRAEKSDVVLILAFDEDGSLVGYVGALPDQIHFKGKAYDVAWNSCWWSHPEKGKTAVLQLLLALFKAWNDRVCFSDLGEMTQQIIALTKQYNIYPYHGIRVFLKSYAKDLLPRKSRFFSFRVFKPALNGFDRFVNLFMVSLQKRQCQPLSDEIFVNQTDMPGKSALDFVSKTKKQNIAKRGKKEFEWAIAHPWLLTGAETSEQYKNRYHFSYHANVFENYFLEIYKSKKLLGWMMVQNRDGHFRFPYMFMQEENAPLIFSVLQSHMFQRKTLSFVTYHPLMLPLVSKMKGVLKRKHLVRYAAFPAKMGELPDGFIVQDGDGDAIFC
jgi:hypothetical protein